MSGVLMLNNKNYTASGNLRLGGGASFDKVLEAGQISTTSSYATATFEDISDYEYVPIKFYDTVNGVDYDDYRMVKVSDIVGEITLPNPMLHQSITVRMTTTSIRSTAYAGAYYNIYCDILGVAEDLFA